MPNFKTMAVQITEDNYDVAVACLAAGFAANWPKSETLGAYLVINDVECIEASSHERTSHRVPPLLVIGNSWHESKTFFEKYRFVDENEHGERFAEIEKI